MFSFQGLHMLKMASNARLQGWLTLPQKVYAAMQQKHMHLQSHQTLLSSGLFIVMPRHMDAIYQLKRTKSTGKQKEPSDPTHLLKVFVNNVSNMINLNPQKIVKDCIRYNIYRVTGTIESYIQTFLSFHSVHSWWKYWKWYN